MKGITIKLQRHGICKRADKVVIMPGCKADLEK